MSRINTKSFTLAIQATGNPKASRLGLLLPGRLDTKDYVHIRSHTDFLANQGYYAIAFDPPGTWESPGKITSYLAAVQELMDYFDSRPTVLIGHSLGGSIAIEVAAQNSAVVGFAALMSLTASGSKRPVNQPDTEWQTAGSIPFYRDLPPGDHPTPESQRVRFDLPYSFYEDRLKHRGLLHQALHDCPKPKLFITGLYDTQQGPPEAIQQAVDGIAGPKQHHILYTGHSYRYSQPHIDYINQLLGRFVAQFV